MLLAWMSLGDLCFWWIIILCLPSALAGICKLIAGWLEDMEAQKRAQAEEKFKRENPELWRQQELLKLEKERMAMQKELAEQQISQENSRRNAGAIVAAGRFLGWW